MIRLLGWSDLADNRPLGQVTPEQEDFGFPFVENSVARERLSLCWLLVGIKLGSKPWEFK
jgi:hypothetical protein